MVTRLLALFCDLISDFDLFCDPVARLPGEAAHQDPIPSRTFPALCVVRDANIQCARTHTHTHTRTYTETQMPKSTHADTFTHVNTRK